MLERGAPESPGHVAVTILCETPRDGGCGIGPYNELTAANLHCTYNTSDTLYILLGSETSIRVARSHVCRSRHHGSPMLPIIPYVHTSHPTTRVALYVN